MKKHVSLQNQADRDPLCPSGHLLSAGTRGLRGGREPERTVPHQPGQTALEENGAAGKTR